MRLTDADVLKEGLCEKRRQVGVEDSFGRGKFVGLFQAIILLDEQPTVDDEPLRHGEWNGWTATHWTGKKDDNGDPIYAEHIYYKCSECGRRTVIREKFCPNCGAKMDGERREE